MHNININVFFAFVKYFMKQNKCNSNFSKKIKTKLKEVIKKLFIIFSFYLKQNPRAILSSYKIKESLTGKKEILKKETNKIFHFLSIEKFLLKRFFARLNLIKFFFYIQSFCIFIFCNRSNFFRNLGSLLSIIVHRGRLVHRLYLVEFQHHLQHHES